MTEIDLIESSCNMQFVMALKDALNVINGKWKLAIVCTLLNEERRFSDIEKLIKGITPRMVSKELKELEINGVVKKMLIEDKQSKVMKYGLTQSGKQLSKVIESMVIWGQEHRSLSQSLDYNK
jgi:DNA-binding HxlR family transcriptional regulator